MNRHIYFLTFLLVISKTSFTPATCTDVFEVPNDENIAKESNDDKLFQQECNCGPHSSGCKLSDSGKNICSCDPMYEQRLNKCQYCDCGYYEGNCSFTADGKKNCKCQPGFTMDSFKGICAEMCNTTKPCLNGGTCLNGVCSCPGDYTGSWCETPKWCTNGRCGYQKDVECFWDHSKQNGTCRCKTPNHYYLPKDRMCYECSCGVYGSCVVVDNMMVCVCEKGYALLSGVCTDCNCGPQAERCSYDTKGVKRCQCKEGYAELPGRLRLFGAYCEACDCGENGRCRFNYNDDKKCDCEDKYRNFKGKCIECDCGPDGTCEIDKNGNKNCTCDYGFAEKDGKCETCDCNYLQFNRDARIGCYFKLGVRKCDCPSGYKLTSTQAPLCEDINECHLTSPCPANTQCINKPGTYDCKCKTGFKPMFSSKDVKTYGCQDIDECAERPCLSPATECVNSIGSYDCVCKSGFYPTSANKGFSYKPAYNNCYVKETQWREASIALGVILSVGILCTIIYIRRNRQRI